MHKIPRLPGCAQLGPDELATIHPQAARACRCRAPARLLLLLCCSRCLLDTSALPACRHKGVLQVWVMQAKDLHKQDVTGKADPFVELSTRVQQVEKTVSHQCMALDAPAGGTVPAL